MKFLSKQDQKFFADRMFGNGPTLISTKAMIRQQGNGNYTGIARQTYSDGSHIDSDFVMNAKTIYQVREAWTSTGWAAQAA